MKSRLVHRSSARNPRKLIYGLSLSAILAGVIYPLVIGGAGAAKNPINPLNSNPRHIDRISRMIGGEVRNGKNQRIGKLEDVLVDLESGRVLYAIVSAGGILGVGEKLLAVPPGSFAWRDDQWHVDADKAKLSAAPEYSHAADQQGQMESPSFVRTVYGHFGQTSWWQGVSSSSSTGQFGNVHRVSTLRSMRVRSKADESLGSIEDVVMDLSESRLLCVIVAADRKLGFNGDLFAVPPSVLALNGDKRHLVAAIGRDKLAAAPRFSGKNWPDFSSDASLSQIYAYYGKPLSSTTLPEMQATSARTNSSSRIYPKAGNGGE